MNAVLLRIGHLLRPSSETLSSDPAQTLTIDLGVAAVGFAIFGASIASGGGALWHLAVAAKVSGAFLTAFLLSLPPLFAIKRFFGIEARFAEIVSGFGSHLALGGIFAAASTGLFVLLRRDQPDFDGFLAVSIIVASIAGVLISRARSRVKWLAPLPAIMAVSLFLSLLAQSAWAYRPYMDPKSPTLFQARLEWFAGEERERLERTVLWLGGSERR
jgi:hypothetical protein